MNETAERSGEVLEVVIGPDRRLLVSQWENCQGLKLVTIAPEYLDRSHNWRLSHSGLMLTPDAARSLAPVILMMAASIDASPADPAPTQADREDSRMP
jgi:hypothetical protein